MISNGEEIKSMPLTIVEIYLVGGISQLVSICDWICEKVPFSHTKCDPFFEL